MQPERLRILLVEDQPVLRAQLRVQLSGQGHEVIEAGDALAALQHFHEQQPDLVLLDVILPQQDGYWLARQIRQQEGSRWTPIIFLSSMDREGDLQQGIDAGGDDYLTKPVSPVVLRSKLIAMQRLLSMRNQLSRATEDLRTANYRLTHLCSHDELTGLGNRRGLNERMQQYIGQARREQRPLTLLMCDVDHFKRYNDALGHLEGDRCLQHVAGMISSACRRPLDYCARFGGEEFALLLPNTPPDGAVAFVLALMHQIRANAVDHPDSPLSHFVTLSGGMTTCVPDHDTTAESMLRLADESLYAAKQRGRQRFVDLDTGLDTSALQDHGVPPSPVLAHVEPDLGSARAA
jgi:diguanylate cyclase (GGDEF)-like protein